MCTIIISNQHHKDFPLVIAANRDENVNRKSSPVQILNKENLIIGGRDEHKGGTWLGVNKQSIFAAITNQGTTKKNLKSRGEIVMEVLKRTSIKDALSYIEDINPSQFNGFNIVFGNTKEVFVAHSYILHSMVIREIPKGIHVITNDMKFDGTGLNAEKHKIIHNNLDRIVNADWLKYYAALKKILASTNANIKIKQRKNKDGSISGNCTVSSSVLAFSQDKLERYKFHDRISYKPRKSEDEPIIPRYKDYIDLWRGSENKSISNSEEECVATEEIEDASAKKDQMLNALDKFKNRLENI